MQFFKDYCKQKSKLFVPDSPRQDAVADSLSEHYSNKPILQGIEWYIDNNDGPFLIFDFAIESRKIMDKMIYETESKNRFKDIVEETRKRMAQ